MIRLRWMPRAVAAVALVVGVGACSGGPPEAPVRPAVGKPVHYVALGGDDVFGGRRRLATSWPQLLFRNHLAVNATLVNLASEHQGGAEIRQDQVPTAVRLRPDLVTITLVDDLERATAPQAVQRDLSAIISSLRRIRGVRILVGTAPRGTGSDAARRAFNAAITTAVRTQGADIVDLSKVSTPDSRLRAQQTADAFSEAIGRP